jgi:hypothetical protein
MLWMKDGAVKLFFGETLKYCMPPQMEGMQQGY